MTTSSSGGYLSNYSYDHAGRRVQQTVAGNITNYLWDEYSQYGDVILESNAAYQYERHYTLANGMLLSHSQIIANEIVSSYYLSDAQGSTRALADTNGAITDSYAYDAFGNLTEHLSLGIGGNLVPNEDDIFGTNYLYTGQQFDTNTELYSLRARYYDPSVGRFLSRDTWAYDYQNPFELNRYAYAANNPLRYVDPSGYISNTAPIQKQNVEANLGLEFGFKQPFISGAKSAVLGMFWAAVIATAVDWAISYHTRQAHEQLGAALELFLKYTNNLLDFPLYAVGGGLAGVALQPLRAIPRVPYTPNLNASGLIDAMAVFAQQVVIGAAAGALQSLQFATEIMSRAIILIPALLLQEIGSHLTKNPLDLRVSRLELIEALIGTVLTSAAAFAGDQLQWRVFRGAFVRKSVEIGFPILDIVLEF